MTALGKATGPQKRPRVVRSEAPRQVDPPAGAPPAQTKGARNRKAYEAMRLRMRDEAHDLAMILSNWPEADDLHDAPGFEPYELAEMEKQLVLLRLKADQMLSAL